MHCCHGDLPDSSLHARAWTQVHIPNLECCLSKILPSFHESDPAPGADGFNGSILAFNQVATEAQYLSAPQVTSDLLMAPSERVVVVIDFKGLPSGAKVTMFNDANAPYPDGDPPTDSLSQVLQFQVFAGPVADPSKLPPVLDTSAKVLNPANAVLTRYITLTEVESSVTGLPLYSLVGGLHFSDPVDIKPRWGTMELWSIINLTGDWHPLHIHLVPHQLLSIRYFDTDLWSQGGCRFGLPIPSFTENASLPSCFTGQMAVDGVFKDSTKIPSGAMATLAIQFSPPEDGVVLPFDPTTGPGYVFHCHILDHEDNEMMRPFVVVR